MFRFFLCFALSALLLPAAFAFRPDPSAQPNYLETTDNSLGVALIFVSPERPMGLYTLKNISSIYDIDGIWVSVIGRELSEEEKNELLNSDATPDVVSDETPDDVSDEETQEIEAKLIDFYVEPDPQNVAAQMYDVKRYPTLVYRPDSEKPEPFFSFDPTKEKDMEKFKELLEEYRQNPDLDKFRSDYSKDFHYCDHKPDDPDCADDTYWQDIEKRDR